MRLTDHSGQELVVLVSGAPLWDDGRVNGAVTVWHDVTDIERAHEQAQKLAAIEERQRLARELHDSVSQALYGIALGANSALAMLEKDLGATREALAYVNSLADLGLTEMRALIFELRLESLEREGLVEGLAKHAAALRARSEVEIAEELCGEPPVPLEVKETVYRIAREAMQNAVKHSQATAIRLRLRWNGEWLDLEVSDNGVGFDPAQPFDGHLGLRSMRERAAGQGGELLIDSAPGAGTRVELSIRPAGIAM